ncbi:hypothetical protein [Kitasatospora sp. NPDC056531]|uniref:hypothetical protein n=1 Tax=Kitasatospora sp. NPDC056531 TaxID=3345856 RepID=UPI003697C84B
MRPRTPRSLVCASRSGSWSSLERIVQAHQLHRLPAWDPVRRGVGRRGWTAERICGWPGVGLDGVRRILTAAKAEPEAPVHGQA